MADTSLELYSREDIEVKLTAIAKNFGYSGEILNMIVALLTESIYITNMNSFLVLREGSLYSATQLDSLLALCHDNMTPVFRGSCQRLNIEGVVATENKKVKAFDLLDSKSSNFKLYFVEDRTFDTNEGEINLNLIVGGDIISYDNENGNDERLYSDNHIIDIFDEDLTEDFILIRNEQVIYDSDTIPLDKHTDPLYKGNMYTKNAKTVSEIIPYYITTVPPNYSIRIYKYTKFLINDRYVFKCIKRVTTGKDISVSLINELQGFVFKNSKPTIKSIPLVDKDNSVSYLKLKTIVNYRDRNYISSYNAVKNAIELKLSMYFLGFAINIIKNQIIITYVLKDNAPWSQLVIDEFKQQMVFSYKVTEEIVFEKAQEKFVRLFLRVYYSNQISDMDIISQINMFESKVGGTYSLDELKAFIKQGNVLFSEDIPEEELSHAIYREEDRKLSLEEEVDALDEEGEVIKDNEGNPIKKKVIYRLRFDRANETNNDKISDSGLTNFVVEFLPKTQTI